AGAYRPPVNPGNGCDFSCGSGTDHLICGIQVKVTDVLFFDGNSQGPGDLQQYHAGNTTEVIERGRGDDLPVFDNIQVVAGTFGYIPVRIKEYRLVPSFVVCLDLRKDVVEIIEAFDIRRHGFCRVPADRDRHSPEALLVQVTVHCTPCHGNDNNRRFRAFARVKPEVPDAAG